MWLRLLAVTPTPPVLDAGEFAALEAAWATYRGSG
jgi:hypothetical protein